VENANLGLHERRRWLSLSAHAGMYLTMTVIAQRDEIIRVVAASFGQGHDVVNVELNLLSITLGTAVAISPADRFGQLIPVLRIGTLLIEREDFSTSTNAQLLARLCLLDSGLD